MVGLAMKISEMQKPESDPSLQAAGKHHSFLRKRRPPADVSFRKTMKYSQEIRKGRYSTEGGGSRVKKLSAQFYQEELRT